MSDTTVTVSDEDEDGTDAAETATVDSVREQGKAEGAAEVHASDAATEALNAEFAASDARSAAETAAQAAEATSTAALATAIEGEAIRSEIAGLREAIERLAAANAAPVDVDGDGIPDPVTTSDVDPSTDEEPQQRGNWLNRKWGRKGNR